MEYGDRDLLRFQACEMVSLKFGLAIDDDRRDAKPALKNPFAAQWLPCQ